ncbi:hypothetical protein [Kitasatospora sp. LaBMicrA B282]|uniref:hypothetical protein n=1 Tax=Kitasatospora sp. LaBMicrA B282 TaxID=3420949 RepID=UPI003D0D7C45
MPYLLLLLGCAVVVLAARLSIVQRTAQRALATAEEAKRVAAARPAAAQAKAARVVLTKAPAADRTGQLAVLHTDLVQVLGRRAAQELPAAARAVAAAPVSAAVRPSAASVPRDAVPVPASPADDGLPRLSVVSGPQDRVTAVPQAQPGERFHYAGVRTGPGEQEFRFEWPEPGAVAVAEAVVSTEGQASVTPMTRTATAVHTHDQLVRATQYSGTVRRRALLTPEATHLKVETQGTGQTEWSVRLLGPSELDELVDERSGAGRSMLMVRPAKPVELVVHAKSRSSWTVEFVCGCWAGPACSCKQPKQLSGYVAPKAFGTGEAIEVLTIPRPGLVIVHAYEESDPWQLKLRPLGAKK